METLDFIREKFREYYLKNAIKINAPSSMEKREFGFVPFKKEKVMVRHRSFESLGQLVNFIKSFVPSDVYYSSAYYKNPGEEKMVSKEWLGADLVFDIDCDHIQTPCKKTHDTWICPNCGKTFVEKPTQCPTCHTEKFEEETWICEKCLDAAKNETLKLISILEEDFGISSKNINVVFSGHRGYHIHLEDETLRSFGVDERKEISDYITGLGLNIRTYQPKKRKLSFHEMDVSGVGWSGRMARALYGLILKNPEDLAEIGLKKETVKKIVEKRDKLMDLMSSSFDEESLIKIVGKSAWINMVEKALQEVTVPIDTVVTTDIHRLIRMPDTLHGKTGFRVVPLTVDQLYDFKPLEDALIAKDETVKIKIKNAKTIRIGGETYGPYVEETVNLPFAPALFFLCKGKASPV